jgi:hypothetical protein
MEKLRDLPHTLVLHKRTLPQRNHQTTGLLHLGVLHLALHVDLVASQTVWFYSMNNTINSAIS